MQGVQPSALAGLLNNTMSRGQAVALCALLALMLSSALTATEATTERMDSYVLSAEQWRLAHEIAPQQHSDDAADFVRIRVFDVANPTRIRLTFDVAYRSPDGRERRLGSFSLFPPDNPGTFIIATRGQVQPGDTLVVTMVPLDPVNTTTPLRVHIAPPTLVER